MAQAHDIQALLESKTTRLRQLEAPYLRALEFLKGLEWQQLRDKTLIRIQQAAALYQGKDATEAVFILGRIKEILLSVQEPTDIIAEYEGLKREIENYYNARA